MIAAELSTHSSLLVVLISVAGGGTLIPLLYSVYQRRTPAARVAAVAKDEQRSAHAAKEAVSAVVDVLTELRTERSEDKAKIARLEARCAELEAA